MTDRFGNRGRKPGKPSGTPPPSSRGFSAKPPAGYQRPERQEQPNFRVEEEDEEQGQEPPVTRSSNRSVQKPSSSTGRRAYREPAVTPIRIDSGKRLVALVFDVLGCYVVAAVIGSLPFIKQFVDVQITWVLLLLGRDVFFSGRGIGKNLMGLQVVDVTTGKPCNLFQSVLRNIIILLPAVVVLLLNVILRLISVSWLNEGIRQLVNIGGMIYTAVVLPLEAHRAYSRDDSRRIGDELAGTAIVEAPMDFTTVLPK